MRSSFAITLLQNASTTSAGQPWPGGRSALLVMGTLATTTKLQVLGPDNSTWVDAGANITSAGITTYDLPAGTYRLELSSGSPAGVYATLSTVPYT